MLDSGQVPSMMYAPKSASSMFQNLSFPFTLALPWALRTHSCSVPFYGVSFYAPQTRQLKQQSFMLSEFWGPKVQNHGVSRAVVSLEESRGARRCSLTFSSFQGGPALLSLQTYLSNLHPPCVSSMSPSLFPHDPSS